MTSSVGRARAALASRDFQRLLLARYGSQLGDGLFQAFIFARLVFLDTDSQTTAVALAKAVALLIVPFSLVGPFAGVFIDRWSRRRILAYTPLLKSVCLVPLLFGDATWLIYVLALAVVSSNRFYLTTAGAVNPTLVSDENLLVANAMASTAGTVITAGGLAVGSRLAGHFDPKLLLVGALVCWPVASGLASTIRSALRADRPSSTIREDLARVARDFVSGTRRLLATPPALAAVTSVFYDQMLINITAVLSIIIFKDQFKQGVASYSNIVIAAGAGVAVGMVTVGLFEARLTRARIMAMAFGIAGITSILIAPIITGPTILLLTFVLAMSFPWRKTPADTIVQGSLPDRFRGRVFAIQDIAFTVPRVLAALVVVVLVDVLSLSTAWIVGLTGVLFLVWPFVLLRWVQRPRYVRLRFYEGGRAEETPRAVVVAGEEEAVEVVDSRLEERGGARVRRFRLRTADEILDVTNERSGERWRVEEEIPLDLAERVEPTR